VQASHVAPTSTILVWKPTPRSAVAAVGTGRAIWLILSTGRQESPARFVGTNVQGEDQLQGTGQGRRGRGVSLPDRASSGRRAVFPVR
jgi:hypothetical protein